MGRNSTSSPTGRCSFRRKRPIIGIFSSTNHNQTRWISVWKGMVELHDRKKPANSPELIGRCVVSFILVLLTQCTQFLVPQFFSDLSVFIQLLLSGLSLSHVLLWSWLIAAINWEFILILQLCYFWQMQALGDGAGAFFEFGRQLRRSFSSVYFLFGWFT